MGFRELLINSILIGLGVFALLYFAYQTAIDNNANDNILNDKNLNASFSALSNQLNNISASTNIQFNSTSNEKPTINIGGIVLETIVGSGRIFTGFTTGLYQIFIVIFNQYLGIPEILINGFIAILLISVILLLWRLFRIGS